MGLCSASSWEMMSSPLFFGPNRSFAPTFRLNDEGRTPPVFITAVLDDAMPITFSCPCGKILRVADQHAGKRVKCPACQAISTVPAPEPEPEFEIVEPAPKPVARPVARPRADDDQDEGGSYGLARPGGGRAAVRAEESEEPAGTYGFQGRRRRCSDDVIADKPYRPRSFRPKAQKRKRRSDPPSHLPPRSFRFN